MRDLVLLVVLCVLIGLQFFHVRQLQHHLAAANARTQAMIEQCEGMVNTLNRTTANLERQNAAVAMLLAEKRAAWGIPQRTY